MWADWQAQIENNTDEINWSNDFYSNMFSLDFDCPFSTIDSESFSHFVIDTINSNWW